MNPALVPSSRFARLTILRTQSDERLRDLVRQGSDAAFEAIVDRYRRSLVRHCAHIVGHADAEEAVQDALVSAHAALRSGTAVRTLAPWLHAVAHNAALRTLRRSTARAESLQEDCDCRVNVDAPEAPRAELRELVQAVQSLPTRQRDAIVMRELEGRSYEEIATRLGASDGAVRQLLNRARRSMRESLGALIPAGPLVKWVLSANEASPARGLLTLSGGSAVAVKLASAAAISAVSVVTLLPPTQRSTPGRPARAAPRPSRHTSAGPRSSPAASQTSPPLSTLASAAGADQAGRTGSGALRSYLRLSSASMQAARHRGSPGGQTSSWQAGRVSQPSGTFSGAPLDRTGAPFSRGTAGRTGAPAPGAATTASSASPPGGGGTGGGSRTVWVATGTPSTGQTRVVEGSFQPAPMTRGRGARAGR